MKIGIIGNMNNMYFPLARYLADAGYDCDLLVFDHEPSHFHPSADTFQKNFNFGIRRLTWGDPAHFFSTGKQAEMDLKEYSFLIGNGTAPAFVNRMGRTLDMFIPYGEDLYIWPFAPLVHPLRQMVWLRKYFHLKIHIASFLPALFISAICSYLVYVLTLTINILILALIAGAAIFLGMQRQKKNKNAASVF